MRNGLTLFAMLLAACSPSGLATIDYLGDPLVAWRLLDREGTLLQEPQARLSLFWSTTGLVIGETDAMLEDEIATRGQLTEPEFVMPIFSPPPAAVLFEYGGQQLAVGGFAVYIDADGDGRRGPDEAVTGLSMGRVVLYTAGRLDAADSPTGRRLEPGYHLPLVPFLCGPLPATTPGDCGVDLGAPCTADAQCAPGVCVPRPGPDLPGRICAIPEPPLDGCRPGDGGLKISPTPDAEAFGYYLRGCETDADCPGGQQICRADDGLCGPDTPLSIADYRRPGELCADAEGDMGGMGGGRDGMGGGRDGMGEGPPRD